MIGSYASYFMYLRRCYQLLLLWVMQISGLSVAVVFFALMRQARSWEVDLPMPSLLSAVESNLIIPAPFLFLAVMPIFFALLFSCLSSLQVPPTISFIVVSILCYVFANGAVIMIISISQFVSHIVASAHVFIKKRLVVLPSLLSPVLLKIWCPVIMVVTFS